MKQITVKMNRGERVHPAARPGYHYANGPPALLNSEDITLVTSMKVLFVRY